MSAAARKSVVRPSRKLKADTITLAHGSGGKAMRDLIDDVFVQTFDNDALDMIEDQARFDLSKWLSQARSMTLRYPEQSRSI